MSRFILLPGLVADERLFSYQKKYFEIIETPIWLAPQTNEPLASYCERWANELTITSEDLLGGMSFGGQVALELAKHTPPKALFLLSAHKSASEISPTFKAQEKLLRKLPENLVKSGLKKLGLNALAKQEGLNSEQALILSQMLESMDYSFFKWAAWATANWDYEFKAKDYSVPIFHLHGELDSIIKLPKDHQAEIISGAKHLINLTHADQVNQWLEQKMETIK